MDERIGFALFFVVFIIVYTLLNYFVLSQFYRLFHFEKNVFFYVLLGVLAISYLIGAGLEIKSNNGVFRAIYIFASVWMGVLFLMFCALFIYFIINKFVPITTVLTGLIILSLILIVTIYSIVNAYNFKIKEVNIYTDKNVSLRVVQLSDIHLGPINGATYLKRIVDKVNSANPDVVLITGDLFDGRYNYNKDILAAFNDVKCPVYFSSGNHDYYSNLSMVESFVKNTKVKWLRNELVEFKGTYIIGLDDTRDSKNIGAMLYALNMEHNLSKKYSILMNHRPIGFNDASKYVDLMLSGHTHAGQIWPFTYLVFVEGNPMHGIHRVRGNPNFMLFVHSGTGTWGPPMRLGSDTEIVVFNIHGKK